MASSTNVGDGSHSRKCAANDCGPKLSARHVMSTGLTPSNFVGNAVATIVVTKWENVPDETELHAVLKRRPTNAQAL
jgi:hypothetical protein